jgi:betaine reductase
VVNVVHYLNQFYAGLGAEEAAGHEPVALEGAQGPGRGLAAAAGVTIAATVACGDDYFGEHETDAVERLCELILASEPAVVVAGPAFGSGRYGYACGTIARALHERRPELQVVVGMHPENPGVAAAEGRAIVVETSTTVTGMRDALPRMAAIVKNLAAGEPLGPPHEAGYLPRGFRRNERAGQPGALRAIDLVLDKASGEVRSEIPAGFDAVPPPPPVADAAGVRWALGTEGGMVPRGNPDRLATIRAAGWHSYSIAGLDGLGPDGFETVHGGFEVAEANADPNRLVPLDVVRDLEREGRIGPLRDELFTTTGNGTPVARSTAFGQEIAAELRESQIGAVILTAT